MASFRLVVTAPIFVRASASPPRAASINGADSAAAALTIESALARIASETLSESLRIVTGLRPPRPPPPPPPCAFATVVTATNIAAAIAAIRIIFFIACAPSGSCGVIRRAHIRRLPGHHCHRTATSATGAPRPAQRQALWRQQLSCRPLAQTLKTAILTRPSAGRLHSDELVRYFRPAKSASVTLPPPSPSSSKSDRNATDSGCGRAVTADCVSAYAGSWITRRRRSNTARSPKSPSFRGR